jgi:hypothetical protein
MAAKPKLNLEEKICRLGKISNNLERHGTEYVTGFTIPITGLLLTKAELNAFLGDKFTHQSWFDTSNSALNPMSWWGEEWFYVTPTYEADELTIKVSGNKNLSFESEDPKGDADDAEPGLPACVLSGISLRPLQGGQVEMNFKLYLRPGMGKENLALQEHQHREVKITIKAKAQKKSDKQPALPFGAPAEDAVSGDGEAASAAH